MAWGAIAAAVGSSLVSAYGQAKTNQANREISQRQMDHQLYMSNTAYQRGMEDMRRAGLNPILAYRQGGATTSPGASIAQQNPLSPFANASAAASAYQLQMEQAKRAVLENKKFEKYGTGSLADKADTAEKIAKRIKGGIEVKELEPSSAKQLNYNKGVRRSKKPTPYDNSSGATKLNRWLDRNWYSRFR